MSTAGPISETQPVADTSHSSARTQTAAEAVFLDIRGSSTKIGKELDRRRGHVLDRAVPGPPLERANGSTGHAVVTVYLSCESASNLRVFPVVLGSPIRRRQESGSLSAIDPPCPSPLEGRGDRFCPKKSPHSGACPDGGFSCRSGLLLSLSLAEHLPWVVSGGVPHQRQQLGALRKSSIHQPSSHSSVTFRQPNGTCGYG